MHHSDLLSFMGLLSKLEIRRAEQFLKSSYHNKSPLILRLFQYIRRYHPDLDSHKLKKKNVFAHLYPGEKFEERRLKNPMSGLKKLLEDFLRVEQLKNEDAIRSCLLINACYERCSYDEFAKVIHSRVGELQEMGTCDASYYEEMLWLQEELYYHPNRSKYPYKKSSFSILEHHLDQFYMLSKFRFGTDSNVRKEVINEDDNPLLDFKRFLTAFEPSAQSNPLFGLYQLLYQFQDRKPTAEEFSAGIQLLTKLLPLMQKKEQSFTLNCLVNTAIRYHNEGDTVFTDYTSQLYQLADRKNLLLYRGRLQASTFLNIVVICCAAGNFDFAKNFIEKYEKHLSDQDTLQLAWGYWFFLKSRDLEKEKKQPLLHQAHDKLAKLPYSELIIDLRLRSLQIRVYYELDFSINNYGFFINSVEAFEKWLVRSTIMSEKKRNSYLNFVRLTKQLGRVANEGQASTASLEGLLDRIRLQENLSLKEWLLEKVEELR